MKKGFRAKYGVSLLTMNAFLRACGLPTSDGKIDERIVTAFRVCGMLIPAGLSLKRFCHLHGAFIKAKGAGFAASPPDLSGQEFLSSYAWRRLRMEALRKHGARCQCCGASPSTGAVMNVDHIKPRKLFPDLALDIENLQVLCHDCNHGKGNWDQTDWRETKVARLA
jgi:hypothetical protein